MNKPILQLSIILLIIFFTTSSDIMNLKQEKESLVLITTTYGNIKVKLYNETPKHRDNFIKLVREGFYDSLLFHRVINNFMIQAGDPLSKNATAEVALGNGGPDYTLPSEIVYPELFHKKGALAAARQGDQTNPTRRSSGSQFYIVHGQVFTDEQLNQIEDRMGFKFPENIRNAYKTIGGTPHLDGQYTVFGEVIEGLDIVDKIAALNTGNADRPLEDVVINMSLIEK